jgi:hypothetical protein
MSTSSFWSSSSPPVFVLLCRSRSPAHIHNPRQAQLSPSLIQGVREQVFAIVPWM